MQWASRTLSPPLPAKEPEEDEFEEESVALPAQDEDLTELRASIPASFDPSRDTFTHLFPILSTCRRPLSFEIVGSAAETIVQLACGRGDSSHVQGQITSFFPELQLTGQRGNLQERWCVPGGNKVVAEFGLGREFMLPLHVHSSASDAMIGIVGAMQELASDETAVLQVLFEPVRHPWASSILRAMVYSDGSPLFDPAWDMLAQAKEKVSRPLFATVIRIACRAGGPKRAWELARRLSATLRPLSDPMGNELIPLENEGYLEDEHDVDVIQRRCRRSGMLLNSDELACLVHFPSAAVQSAKLHRQTRRTKAVAAVAMNGRYILGHNEHAGQVQEVSLNPDQRVRHMHVVGASGTGKSTLLLNLILQDIRGGQGVAVLDPHGDLIDEITARIPEERAEDVVVFAPGDEEHPIGFNILAAHSEVEKTLLSSDLVGIFRRLSTSWGDQMNALLANGVLAILENPEGGTVIDLRRLLVEPAFRAQFLERVRDDQVTYYWRKEFPLLVGKPQGPVLTRLNSFLRPRVIRRIVAQKANRLDFREIMDRGRVFLARLSHGAIGEENAHLLGALLVAKFNQLAMGRQQIQEAARRDFWIYADEFQHFATPSMASLLSGVRKYRVGLVLAHQELHQLESRSPDLASAVLSNAHTRICFRVGDQDARKLADGFSTFESQDLQNLGTGEAVCRVERADFDFNLKTAIVEPVDARSAALVRERVVSASRKRYASSREAVDQELARNGVDDSVSGESPSERERAKPKDGAPETQPSQISEARIDGSGVSAFRGETATAEQKKPPKPAIFEEPKLMGRGGPEHKYVQQLIKQWAEGLGYRATIEKQLVEGSVDVALEKKGRSIACETSITTAPDWELGNIRKCLNAGFSDVLLVCPDAKKLAKLRIAIEPQLKEDERKRVKCVSPDELFGYVQQLELGDLEQEKTIKGYKVKRTIAALDAEGTAERRQRVTRVVANSLKRLHKEK
jgi:hypothetical protein